MLEILNKETFSKSRRRMEILGILEEGLRAADPKNSVKKALDELEGEIKRSSRVFVIGFGKAALKMAEGCEEILKNTVHGGVIIIPKKTGKISLKKIKVLEGTHPIPSKINIESTRRLISFCSNLTGSDIVICLISGGGSSLLTLPANGVSLEDKKKTADILLKSGADIREINTVRKHISNVKGGRLLNFLKPARVISLILSDIVGDPVEYIASGPTSPDPSTFKDAYDVIMKYGLKNKLPRSVIKRIEKGMKGVIPETPKPGDKLFHGVRNIVVSNNMKSLIAMEKKARELGYNTMILTSFSQGEAREVGRFLSGVIRQITTYDTPVKKPACLIMGGETTVTVKGGGKGGRNQELVLSTVNSCSDMENFVFASIGSDGIDGCTAAAGAIADVFTLKAASSANLNLQKFLENNNSYSFFRKTNDLIFTGLTGTNVNDLSVIMIY